MKIRVLNVYIKLLSGISQYLKVNLFVSHSFSLMQIITTAIGTTYGSEIVLLTDGEDSSMSVCRERVRESGAIIHTIALGPAAAKELEEFSNITGK